MNYRINTKIMAIVISLVLFATVLFVGTLFIMPTFQKDVGGGTELVPVNKEVIDARIIDAKHQYVDGIHTIAGRVEVLTPCHRLVTEPFFTRVDDTNATSVEVRFNTLLDGGTCPSKPHEVPFKVSFEAPPEAVITATWNGSPVRLNLVPVSKGETINDALNMKG